MNRAITLIVLVVGLLGSIADLFPRTLTKLVDWRITTIKGVPVTLQRINGLIGSISFTILLYLLLTA